MFGSFAFLVGECWRNVRRQSLMVLACVSTAALSLTMLGLWVFIGAQAYSLMAAAPRQFEVHAFMPSDARRSDSLALMKKVAELPGVARVRLIAREEAWAEFRRLSAHRDVLEGFEKNPLPDKLQILTARPEQTLVVAAAVRRLGPRLEVVEGGDTLRRLLSWLNIARIAGLSLVTLFSIGTAFIVGNAIRLTLYSRRRDIRVMQLVGATDNFIRLPFVMEGILTGALGGAVAGALIVGLSGAFSERIAGELAISLNTQPVIQPLTLGMALLAAGALLGLLGSTVSIRRFLARS
jgi:cell division transport system permease protein